MLYDEVKPITIEKRRDSFWIYPFTKSYYSKNHQKVIGTCPKLDRMFSEFDPVYRRYKLNLKIYDKRNKILKLPEGVGLETVKKVLEGSNIYNYTIIDKSEEYAEIRDIHFKINKGYKPKDEIQEKSVKFLVHKDMKHKKMLSLNTGLGKTFCTVYSLFNMYMPSVIISANLSDQWITRIEEYTNCTIKNGGIYELRGRKSIDKLLKTKHKHVKHVFYVASTQTLAKYIENGGDIQELFDYIGIGVKVFDEVHMNYSANTLIDTNTDVYTTFYLTATPDRSAFAQKKIFSLLFQNVPVYGITTHEILKHYNIRLVNYNTHSNEQERIRCFTKEGFSAVNYFNYLFSKNENIVYIFGMIKMLYDRIHNEDEDAKVLVFVPKLSYIDELQKLFYKYSYITGNYTSSVHKKIKNLQLHKTLIFSTIGSSYAGLDLQNLTAIISITPFSSNIIARQMIGRLREIKDKEVFYYDFVDTSFQHMDFQRQKRMQVFRPIAKTILEKTFTQNEVLEYLKEK